ncbi:hypothetical protein ABJ851_003215 [Shigella flexneri]|nr:hypothetical protein [Escherichia coli]
MSGERNSLYEATTCRVNNCTAPISAAMNNAAAPQSVALASADAPSASQTVIVILST